MKIPQTPPEINKKKTTECFMNILFSKDHALSSYNPLLGKYLHWDKLMHLEPPKPFGSVEDWWIFIKMNRAFCYKHLALNTKDKSPFKLAVTDEIQKKVLQIDQSAAGNISATYREINSQTRDTYIVHSLTEEAITSSQLEGAATTHRVAKEMLRQGRKPRDQSEQMIYNNYQAMQFIKEYKDESLTLELILELHKIITEDTLEKSSMAGKLRTTDDIHIVDENGKVLYEPPKAIQLKQHLQDLCRFANGHSEIYFIHPVIRAILIHFALAYYHPFVDGNGRTARALFYLSMAQQGYWLMEFISISQILKAAPSKYARAYLYTETDENDVTYFVIHQIDVILKAIANLNKYISRKENERQELFQILKHDRLSSLNYRQLAILEYALNHPTMYYEIRSHQHTHDITYDTARTDLLKLAELNLLIKEKMGRAFVFVSPKDLRKRIKNLK
jgi:Fic family protein